ncbi:hypothetical protein [Thalassospira sp.]|uniref:hypothetical protein n=1 Tax=Thalassospira sp. TaxID=1912094 RepID=UPI0032EE60CC
MLFDMNNAYQNGRLMLMLRAGASYGSHNPDDLEMPMGDGLAKELILLMVWTCNGYQQSLAIRSDGTDPLPTAI